MTDGLPSPGEKISFKIEYQTPVSLFVSSRCVLPRDGENAFAVRKNKNLRSFFRRLRKNIN